MKDQTLWRVATRFSMAASALCLATFLTACAAGNATTFQQHIDYLASDALEGRGIGSDGIEAAAEYIAEHFALLGIEPGGDDGTYFQSFDMTLHRTLTAEGGLSFGGDDTEYAQGKDFIPFNFSSGEEFRGGVAFCGYGIVAPDKEYDDFAGMDLEGQIVLVLRGEPASWADEDGNPTRHAMYRNKVYNAKDRGAVAVLIVNQEPADGEADELAEFVARSADNYGVPAFHVTRAMAGAQLSRSGVDSLSDLQRKLEGGETASIALFHIEASGQAVFKQQDASTRNVVGVIRGSGPLANEAIVIGAHYDHLGIRKPMMRKFKDGKLVKEKTEPQVHNGADDNASGVSGLIEIARLFAEGGAPKRSVVFVAFTAEETGLHGSKHYVEHPSVAIAETVAMLNMDMIGRLPEDKNDVTVFGVKTAVEFMDILERAGKSVGLGIAGSPDAGGRSDHAPFYRKDVPSLHFFSGHHSDYHKPSDDADKINAVGGAKVATLVYLAAREFADRADRLTFQAVKTPKKQGETSGTPMYRVVMGLAPGYTEDGKAGMSVDAVNPEGPADVAGMKAGDRIIKIGEKKIANIYDYMAATRDNKPGDTIEVVVLRDGKEVTLSVTLAAAG